MAALPAPSRPAGTLRLHRQKGSHPLSPIKVASLMLAILITFAIGVGLSRQGEEFLKFFYSPVFFFLLILLFIEYILLKGRDRSRIYRIELDHARKKRAEDMEYLREIERQLGEIEKQTAHLQAEEKTPETSRQEIEALRERIQTLQEEVALRL